MGLFKKSAQSPSIHTNTNIIAAGTTIKGKIQSNAMVKVDGDFLGKINSTSIIFVGETGLIEGEVISKKLIVAGRFFGSAQCDEIEIKTGGKLAGQIASNILIIERGSVFEGESKLKTSDVRSDGGSAVVAINSKSKTANVG